MEKIKFSSRLPEGRGGPRADPGSQKLPPTPTPSSVPRGAVQRSPTSRFLTSALLLSPDRAGDLHAVTHNEPLRACEAHADGWHSKAPSGWPGDDGALPLWFSQLQVHVHEGATSPAKFAWNFSLHLQEELGLHS